MKKTTKKALFGSVIALILCCAMLIGTTFAWFTDNATTGASTIQAGKLDIDLVDAEGNSLEGKFLNWKTQDNRSQDNILWEPGCTYVSEPFYVQNNSNLAIECKLTVGGFKGDTELLGALDINIYQLADDGSINKDEPVGMDNSFVLFPEMGQTGTVMACVIEAHMKEDAGNAYQGLKLEGAGVILQAKQYAREYDSTTNQYDAKAEYGEVPETNGDVTIINTAAELRWFADQVNVKRNSFYGKTVKLGADIDLENKLWTPIGQTQAGQFLGTFDGQEHTISNLYVDETSSDNENRAAGLFGWPNGATIKNVKIDKATVKGNQYVGAVVGYVEASSGAAVVENCHVTNSTIEAVSDKAGAVVGFTNAPVTNCSATGCTVTAGRDAGQVVGCAVKAADVTGCSATSVTVTANGKGTGENITDGVIGRKLG